MAFIKSFIKALARDQRGATAVEYGIILAMIFLAIITAVAGLGQASTANWTSIATKFQSANGN